jgi:glycosyltransferase involved in cell wall biosynthesis
MELQVVSATSWVPRFLGGYKHSAAYANCPLQHSWAGLDVLYPRILWYPVAPLKQYAYRSPELQMNVAWQSARHSLSKAVREFKPDVLFAHHTAVNGFFAAKLKQSTGVPFVVTDHDFGEISDCEQLPNRKRFFAEIVSRSSMMVAVASRMEQRLRQLFPGVRACTVPNGTEGVPDALKKTERPPDLRGKAILFSCGTFYERKGFPLLIEAFAQVAANFPDAVLRIAGDGGQGCGFHTGHEASSRADSLAQRAKCQLDCGSPSVT